MKELLKGIKKFLKEADMFLLTVCLIASLYGMLLILSATKSFNNSHFLVIQGASILLGILAFIVISLVDMEDLANDYWKLLVVFNVLFISTLFIFGIAGDSGNRSWLRFGSIGVQPAEVVKISFIIVLARQMFSMKDRLSSPLSMLKLLGHLLFICGLIVVSSKDVGVALIYIFIFVGMLFAGGVKLRWFAGGSVALFAAIPLIWTRFLNDDQRMRVLVVLNPALDAESRGKGYQAAQSKIALGAGKLFGRGLFQGTQTQKNRLPAKHTDFIFSVAGEEFGLIGCMIILLLLTIIILRILFVAARAKSGMSSLICVGIATMLIFQTFENIGMCIELLPVVGITLPFFSYGGTSVVTMFAAMGVVSSVKMRPMPGWLKSSG